KYSATVQHNLSPNAQLVNLGPDRPAYWVRNSGSSLWGPVVGPVGNRKLLPETNIQFSGTPTIQNASVEGYYYTRSGYPRPLPMQALSKPRLSYSLLVYDPDYYLEVEELKNVFQSKVYPNPTANAVTVNYLLDGPNNVVFLLSDLQGRTIRNESLSQGLKGEYNFQMNLEGLQSGMYLLKIKAGENEAVHKIFKH
ncbi:MAG: T9SS type A sorting domain-containing protein, partial [Bacteroidetes bacterium]|nr:T9SS type A sorting domain-containing protein [Bacteroidota bacterium]